VNKNFKYIFLSLILIIAFPSFTYATGLENIVIGNDANATVDSVQLLIFMTVLTLIPSILIMTTAFTRIIVTLSFLRSGLGSQQTPPNQVLIGLALFLTFFIMQPTIQTIKVESYDPFINDEITQEEALERAEIPIKEFMLKQTREKDLALFLRASDSENVSEPMDLPISVVIPAFAISELRTAFSIGFIIYIPFLVIDMVVASILMSMGMFMLPPVLISLPFKLLLFVLVDGWYLVVESLVESFI
jgi:flagellar biosynthetic protein FliP